MMKTGHQPAGDSRQAPLFGLVLAGGDSTRMGLDKGTINYHGEPQARYLLGLLAHFCERVLVSTNRSQRDVEPYAGLPLIIDAPVRQGPASGLLAASQLEQGAAWLVVAVDLAALAAETLAALVHARRPSAAATAFRHADGTLEPLCAIWEPAACAALALRVGAGDTSPRRCLESVDVEITACPDPTTLRSAETPAERDALLR